MSGEGHASKIYKQLLKFRDKMGWREGSAVKSEAHNQKDKNQN